MNYTAFTAFIISCHNMSVIFTVAATLIITSLSYVFLRKQKHQALKILLVFLLSIIISSYATYQLFRQKVISIEVVKGG